MARRAAVEDVQQGEQAHATSGAMPSAPEGSAERVASPACVNCGWTEADCNCPVGFTLPFDGPPISDAVSDSGADLFVTVNDYDANGEPSASTVRLEPGQTELPAMPEKVPGLWPDYQGERVAEVHISFSGDHELDRDSASATSIRGRRISGSFEGVVQSHSHKPRKKGGLIGGATIVIDQVSFGGELVVGVDDEIDLEAVRSAARFNALDEAVAKVEELLGDADNNAVIDAVINGLRDLQNADGLPEFPDDEPSALEASLALAQGEDE